MEHLPLDNLGPTAWPRERFERWACREATLCAEAEAHTARWLRAWGWRYLGIGARVAVDDAFAQLATPIVTGWARGSLELFRVLPESSLATLVRLRDGRAVVVHAACHAAGWAPGQLLVAEATNAPGFVSAATILPVEMVAELRGTAALPERPRSRALLDVVLRRLAQAVTDGLGSECDCSLEGIGFRGLARLDEWMRRLLRAPNRLPPGVELTRDQGIRVAGTTLSRWPAARSHPLDTEFMRQSGVAPEQGVLRVEGPPGPLLAACDAWFDTAGRAA